MYTKPCARFGGVSTCAASGEKWRSIWGRPRIPADDVDTAPGRGIAIKGGLAGRPAARRASAGAGKGGAGASADMPTSIDSGNVGPAGLLPRRPLETDPALRYNPTGTAP